MAEAFVEKLAAAGAAEIQRQAIESVNDIRDLRMSAVTAAILRAARAPDQKMIKAGKARDGTTAKWQAMIDQALQEYEEA